MGGNAIISPHGHKFTGIRNGIDPELWSPEDNQYLPVSFNADTVVEGKRRAREVRRRATTAAATAAPP